MQDENYSPRPGPLVQIAATTILIATLALLVYALDRFGAGSVVIGPVVVIAAALGLWFAVWRVGIFSWAIGTALTWVAVAIVAIFQFG